jgi:NNP family nitrate/nitrite transporter-like MFS transporter
MRGTRSSHYRWYILTLAMMVYFFIAGMARMCMPVLFEEISLDLGLSMVEIGAVWGMDPLAGVFITLPGGLLADRFGVKRTLMVICFMTGLFGAMRGLSVNFVSMAATMFLFGLMAASMPSVVPKTTVVWFKGRHLGLANVLLNVAWSVGTMAATMLSATVFSPLLGGWRNVLFLYGAPCIILGLLWFITGREPEGVELLETTASEVPFQQALSRVVRIKQVWIIGVVMLTSFGSSMGLFGYLPLYLREIGWAPAIADSAITILTGVSCIGITPMVLITDRIGSREGILFLSIIIMTVTLGLLPLVNGPSAWVLLTINGFMRGGVFALFIIMIFEMEGVGSAYSGTALGLANTIGMIGAFLAPPLGNSLTVFNPGLPLTFWALLSALGLPFFFFLKERRGKEVQEQLN